MDKVNITYLGHACFRLEYGGQSLVLDPYADNYVPGLGVLRTRANYVYCSHGHKDHCHEASVALEPCGEPRFTVEELVVDHDMEGGALRGKSTVRIFSFGSLRVAHLGDLGRMLTFAEGERLRDLDCLMIPVGGYYTIDPVTAKSIVDWLRPRVVIPMHYRTDTSGYEVIAHINAFTELFDSVERRGSSLTLDESTPARVAVLQPLGMDVSADAVDWHRRGFNCAQSVLCALGKYTGLDERTALAVSGGFGGGLRSGEVCGAISGAVMALGLCSPYTDGGDRESREKIAALARTAVERCGEACGAVTCRELLAREGGKGGCARFIADCAAIAEKMIIENR
ncbi:MAG: C-GCAxxG-C-C family (seleno)protein [Oscillospiraceae bacterium]